MNNLIKLVYENGNSQLIYDIFIAFCFGGVIGFNLWYGQKYKLSKKQAIISSLLILVSIYIWIYILCWAETGFRYFGGKNLVRGFVYIPIFGYPIARILKIDWVTLCDYFAPCGSLAQAINKIGCIFAGCCQGYPWKYGIYNSYSGIKTFPCQILEGITYLLIVIILVRFSKRKNYEVDGMSFPLMLIMFGTSRFFFEFLRDNRKLIWGCSPLSFHALFMVIVGTAALVIIKKKKKDKDVIDVI